MATRLEYFRNRVHQSSECWLWAGPRIGRYGYMCDRRPLERAHRWSFGEFVRPLERGEIVMHLCDVPLCVRPEHLKAGTQADNMRDMADKGRSLTGDRNPMRLHPESRPRGARHGLVLHPERAARGEGHGMAKLSAVQVGEIRRRTETARVLSVEYGTTAATIRDIRAKRTWSHL